MKKILIFGLGHRNGDSRIFYKQALSLKKQFDAKCIGGIFSNKKGTRQEEGIKNIGMKGNRLTNLFKAWLYGLKNKSDIYVAHDIDSYIVVVFIKLFRWNSKIVFDVHEYYNLYIKKTSLGFFEKILIFIFLYILKPITIKLFDGITIVTEDMKDLYPIKIEKEVIYNYPIGKLLDSIKPNNKLDKDYIYLVYHGGISEDRGIWEMVKLIKKLGNNYKLLLIGGFHNIDVENNIKKIIKDNNIENKIILAGKLSFIETISFLKNDVRKIGLLFLENSGQMSKSIPIKMLEYLYLEIPQIGSDHIDSFNEYIIKYNCGLSVKYGNKKQYIKAIEKIYHNYDNYVNNCKKIKNSFIWENEEKKLLKFYKKIIGIN